MHRLRTGTTGAEEDNSRDGVERRSGLRRVGESIRMSTAKSGGLTGQPSVQDKGWGPAASGADWPQECVIARAPTSYPQWQFLPRLPF